MPKFEETADIVAYLQIFERQCEKVKINETDYITHLLPLLHTDLSQIILRELKDKLKDYSYVKRFKLNAESFQIELTTH